MVLGLGARTLTIRSANGEVNADWPLANLHGTMASDRETLQLTPDADGDERIVLSDPRMVSAIREACPGLFRRGTDGRMVRKALFWGAGAIGGALAMIFVIVPALAGQLALMIPPERERQLGEAVVKQVLFLFDVDRDADGGAFCADADGVAALHKMRERVAPETAVPWPIRVDVIDHDMVNAFAVPGGRILIMRGLIDEAETPEEVAGVLAHEIGHVVSRDPTVAALRVAGTTAIFGLMLGDVFGAGVVVAATEALVNARHSREVEQRADETAYALMAEAGLPTGDFAAFFARLAEDRSDAPEFLKYLASHPGLHGRADRAKAADKIGDGAFEPALTEREWAALQRICD